MWENAFELGETSSEPLPSRLNLDLVGRYKVRIEKYDMVESKALTVCSSSNQQLFSCLSS